MEPKRQIIEVFGDSIFKGIQINPLNNRYHTNNQIDIEAIGREHSLTINNHSMFGCTITKGFSLLQRSLKGGLECRAVVMNYGGNDCDFKWKEISENPEAEHFPNTPLLQFEETYRKIIETLRQNAITPVLATLPPLEPQRFFDWFCRDLNKANIMKWLGGVSSIYRYQENYSRTIEKIAKEEKTPLIDLRGAFLKSRRIDHLLCEDGTHPNTEGQKVMTEAIFEFVQKIKPTLG